MSKTIPVSLRISQDDANFLARLEHHGAITASEKIRTLITEARLRANSAPQELITSTIALIEQRCEEIRNIESQRTIHSEIISKIGSWLPQFLRSFLAALPPDKTLSRDIPDLEALKHYELRLVRDVTSLMEGALRLAVTRQEPCYDPSVISSNLSIVRELMEIVSTTKEQKLCSGSEESFNDKALNQEGF